VPLTERVNPYAPPTSDVLAPAPVLVSERLATTGQRFLNYLLDLVGVFVVTLAITLVSLLLGTGDEWLEIFDNTLFGIVFTLVYYAGFEGVFGCTPAKWLTGTRVLAEDGQPPHVGQILIRTVVRIVPFEGLSFLVSDGYPVGWHDRWSGTRVVRTRGVDPGPVGPLAA